MLTDSTAHFGKGSTCTAPTQRDDTPDLRTEDHRQATAHPVETRHPLSEGSQESCRRVHLAHQPAAARYAREAIQHELHNLGLDEANDASIRECAEAVLLIVSELVTNACRHSPGPADLRTTWHDHVMTVEVDDCGRGLPVVVDDDDRGSGGGFGIGLVDALSDGWGYQPRDGGKTVYAHVAFP